MASPVGFGTRPRGTRSSTHTMVVTPWPRTGAGNM